MISTLLWRSLSGWKLEFHRIVRVDSVFCFFFRLMLSLLRGKSKGKWRLRDVAKPAISDNVKNTITEPFVFGGGNSRNNEAEFLLFHIFVSEKESYEVQCGAALREGEAQGQWVVAVAQRTQLGCWSTRWCLDFGRRCRPLLEGENKEKQQAQS